MSNGAARAPSQATRLQSDIHPERFSVILFSKLARATIVAVSLSALLPFVAHSQATIPVDTLPPATVKEASYSIASGSLMLPGTLTLPARPTGKIPVVLIVAGSGPTDRNGNTVAPG